MAAGGEPTPLSGQWKGPLKVPGGSLELIITIVPLTGGTYYAALDVPKQKVSRMPVDMSLTDNDVLLKIEQAGSRFTGKLSKDRKSMTGTWEQPGLKEEVKFVQDAAPVVSAPVFKPAQPYKTEQVIITNDKTDLCLGATITMPNGNGPFPAVVLVSDSGPQDRDAAQQEDYRMFAILADYLARHGMAVLRYDDRGVGKSGGKYAAATTADQMTDAETAMNYLRTRPRIDKKNVGMIGHGEGANIALLAATEPKGPDFVVSLAGYGLPGRDILRRQQVEIMRMIGGNATQVDAALKLHDKMINIIRQTPNSNQARGKLAAMIRMNNVDIDPNMARARAAQLTSPWYRYYLDFDPKLKLPAVKCPVLALNGVEDLQVAATKNLAILSKGLKAGGNRRVKTYKLAGVNHAFQPDEAEWPLVNGEQQPTFSPKALALMQDWFEEYAKPSVNRMTPRSNPKPEVKKVSRPTAQK
ncbi:alpha/beta hydrolase family protein [Hymenobacter cellulosilyticus]|uniref:Alpha/beta hydrolase n=1 Tax=Hymenobacter cellulosilyticus TaxID=2932248 RepID=A0A8T9Q8F6_9BACT|nr:CocE/NonD family hydrolase [Hymenobacter cellulosilyticus]UOQ73836.1 alpha/beta hydrolase [Hymenobacter cellulosilyticus]